MKLKIFPIFFKKIDNNNDKTILIIDIAKNILKKEKLNKLILFISLKIISINNRGKNNIKKFDSILFLKIFIIMPF